MNWTAKFGPCALLLLSSSALAQVAPECADFAGPPPKGYDEGVQADFLQNYPALASTFSPLHAPVPHEPGHGSLGVDLNVMPPLGCERRFALNHTKTEDTNVTPVIPQLSASMAFPAVGKLLPYMGLAYAPPVKVAGTTNVIISAEIGVGMKLGESLQLGARYHATQHRTIGEVATPVEEGAPAYDDLYLANSMGVDLMGGYQIGVVTPYASFGITDISTVFYIGDDGVIANNLHPYFGPAISVGADSLFAERIRVGAELYTAPGGYSMPDPAVVSVDKGTRYGNLTTARLRLGVEI